MWKCSRTTRKACIHAVSSIRDMISTSKVCPLPPSYLLYNFLSYSSAPICLEPGVKPFFNFCWICLFCRLLQRDVVSKLYWTPGDGQRHYNLSVMLENDHISASELLRKSLTSAEDGSLEVVITSVEANCTMNMYVMHVQCRIKWH